MRIAICDDENIYIDQLYELLECHFNHKNKTGFIIDKFNSGVELMDNYMPGGYDFIFLDVYMPEKTGFEVAQEIRERDLDADIIFVTHAQEQIGFGYQYNAKGYLIKPASANKIDALMDRLLDERFRRQCHDTYTVFLKGGGETALPLAEVLYFESAGHDVRAVTKAGKHIFRAQLPQVETDLKDKGFARVHQSYLVNLFHVFTTVKGFIVFKGSSSLPHISISRRYKEAFNKAYDAYKGGR